MSNQTWEWATCKSFPERVTRLRDAGRAQRIRLAIAGGRAERAAAARDLVELARCAGAMGERTAVELIAKHSPAVAREMGIEFIGTPNANRFDEAA